MRRAVDGRHAEGGHGESEQRQEPLEVGEESPVKLHRGARAVLGRGSAAPSGSTLARLPPRAPGPPSLARGEAAGGSGRRPTPARSTGEAAGGSRRPTATCATSL